MAYPVTLNGRTYTLADFEGTNYVEGLPDAFEDFVTHAGDIYNSTSTTSNSIGTGSKTFTVESAKPYQAGTPLRIADAAAPSTNFMDTIVTSYSGTTLVVDSVGYAGSGTFTSWNVNIGGSTSVAGTVAVAQGGTGATTAAAARTNLDVYSKADADSRFLNVSGEASNVTMTGDVTIGDTGSDSLTVNAALSASGSIKLDGNYPTGTDNIALGNAALDSITGSAAGNIAIGDSALNAATSGTNAIAIGRDAMGGIYTGTDSIGIGRSALASLTSAINNVAVGTNALASTVDSGYNTALGMEALYSTNGASTNYNVAVGYQAGYSNTSGNIVAIGRRALYNNTDGTENTAMGRESAHELQSGSHNTAYGYRSLYSATTSEYNTAIGTQALFSQVDGNVSNKSTAVGFQAAYAATRNIDAFGSQAAYGNTTGTNNVAIGRESLYSNQVGTDSTAVGYQSLYSSTNSNNTAIGYRAGYGNTSGFSNVIIGMQAGPAANGTGYQNVIIGQDAGASMTSARVTTAIGYNALNSLVSAHENTAVGWEAGKNVTSSSNTIVGRMAMGIGATTGSANVAVGESAMPNATGANGNIAVGKSSAYSLTSADYGVFIGYEAGNSHESGSETVAIGHRALYANISGASNTAVGRWAGYNVTGSQNTILGESAALNLTTGGENVAIGKNAGRAIGIQSQNVYVGKDSGFNATSYNNTFVGESSGIEITSGANNTILGRYSGNNGVLDIRTTDNNMVLADGDGNIGLYIYGQYFTRTGNLLELASALNVSRHLCNNPISGNSTIEFDHSGGSSPYGVHVRFSTISPDNNGNWFIRCQDTVTNRFYVYSDGDVVNHDNSYGSISDQKLKQQIVDASSQWDDIKALQVRKYKMNEDVETYGDGDEHWRLGVIAQELEASGMSGLVKESPDTDADNNDLGTTTKTVKYSILYMKAVKALQEAMDRIETLEAKVNALENA